MNEKQDIRLVALDMDGTLLDLKGRLSEGNRRTLEAIIERGIHVVVATGRVFSSLPQDVLAVPGLEYAVTSNGANVVELATGKTIYQNLINAENIHRLMEHLRKEELMLEVFFEGKVYADKKCLDNLERYGIVTEKSKKYTLETRLPADDVMALMKENAETMENINLIFGDMERRLALWEELKKWEGITVTSSFHHNLEIGGATTSKADGLSYLCEMLNIAPKQVMAMGDMDNDSAMLAFAGLSVAMGNATESLKKSADFVTLGNDEDGVAYALRKFVLDGEVSTR